ncbi:cytochrome c-type biogenesis protein CcmH [Brevundimonas vesicularis]|uniref:cytochrome c-type biogenesis protein n=1 Tax=Brevundimonas vesicularis TaxID=41276 RepID=UPI0038D3FA46
MRGPSILIAAVMGLCLSLGPGLSGAVAEPTAGPDRPLPDAAQEARARALFTDIRCVVCQHESIADSPAGIAADMRALVREQIAAGQSDQAVREDLVRRYGDYVLFTPPVRRGTWLLWFGPFAAVIVAGVVLFLRARRRSVEVRPLTPEEEEALRVLMAEDGSDRTATPDRAIDSAEGEAPRP